METVTDKPFEGIHELRGGGTGGPGQNSAECACGVIFDGFATYAEVMAEFKRHVVVAQHQKGWHDLASALHEIGDQIWEMGMSGLPAPTHFEINSQPGKRGDDELTSTVIDAIGEAVLDKTGAPDRMGDGTYHYAVHGRRGPIGVSFYNSVSEAWAKANDPTAELRAELEAAEAEAARTSAEAARIRAAIAAARRKPKPLVSDATIEAAGRFEDQQEFDRLRREARTEDEVARLAELGEKLGLDYRAYDRTGGEACRRVLDKPYAPACGAPIRPAFDPGKGWVHTRGIHDHNAVGPAS